MAQLVDTPERREFMKKMSERGWIGMSWPKEYGGQERAGDLRVPAERGARGRRRAAHRQGRRHRRQDDHPARQRAAEEGVPAEDPQRRDRVRDRLLGTGRGLRPRGAQAPLKRDEDGGGWVLNGQKRFTTSAHFADWYWVAARTDPDAPKHKGITLFLVPMDAPGITIQAMDCIADDERTNEVFLDDVFVPDDYVVGEVNKGWYYVSEALDFERFTLFTVAAYVKRYMK